MGNGYSRDPRYVAKKAEAYLTSTGIADSSAWGPELEFFILDDIRYDNQQNAAYYYIDSKEAVWNRGTGKTLGTRGQRCSEPGAQASGEDGLFPGAAPGLDH